MHEAVKVVVNFPRQELSKFGEALLNKYPGIAIKNHRPHLIQI